MAPAQNKPVKASANDADSQKWEDRLEWQRAIEAKKQKIQCAIRGLAVQADLDVLKRAGADADKVLLGLAFAVPDNENRFKAMLKSRQRHLSALADRLEHLSDDLGRAIADPFNSSLFRAVLIPGASADFDASEKLESLSNAARKRIKPILDAVRGEARECMELHRRFDRIETTHYLGGFVQYVKESTGQFHDERTANLLQAAHDALGVGKSFTAEGLRKLRQHLFPSLVKKRKEPTPLDLLLTMTRPLKLDKSRVEK